jgi:hypothetical protein
MLRSSPLRRCVCVVPTAVQLVVSKTITFSSLTTPQIFQNAIEDTVEKRQGRCALLSDSTTEARCTF